MNRFRLYFLLLVLYFAYRPNVMLAQSQRGLLSIEVSIEINQGAVLTRLIVMDMKMVIKMDRMFPCHRYTVYIAPSPAQRNLAKSKRSQSEVSHNS